MYRWRVSDYPNLQGWMRDVWQIKMPGSSMQVRLRVGVERMND
jgi:glutathionyl-hydroquinone reductase